MDYKMRNEIILAFWKDLQKDPPEMGYAKDIVEPLVEEIIRLKTKYEGLIPPDIRTVKEEYRAYDPPRGAQ